MITILDYLGQLIDKEKSEKKVWVYLFIRRVTKALHLELVEDLSAEQFLTNFLYWLVTRRRKPITITSDNAPQFKLVILAIDFAWEGTI